MQLREAVPADLPALLDIYNDAILTSTSSWDYEPWSPVQHADWYAHKAENGYPLLVAVEGSELLGYATYGEFRPKIGYAATREHSVYVRDAARGSGVGSRLMSELIDRAQRSGVHALIGAIAADNEASLALHARLGFVEVGRLPEVGRKFDRWLDLVFVQLTF
ncbi:MAG TPA: GNAT family N-acetyltransferase [Propionibacteriaceae bacterium]|nr:GNAT family N-acetyltransferase [Propionibacteriaceae bacterium]